MNQKGFGTECRNLREIIKKSQEENEEVFGVELRNLWKKINWLNKRKKNMMIMRNVEEIKK